MNVQSDTMSALIVFTTCHFFPQKAYYLFNFNLLTSIVNKGVFAMYIVSSTISNRLL